MKSRWTLESGETLDALFRGRMVIFQRKRGYRLSLDAVLLARFIELKGGERVVDLGAGNGVIALLLALLHPSARVVGLEVQETMVERALRSVRLNRLEGRVEISRGDVRFLKKSFAPESFDAAVSNPPYLRPKSGRTNPDPERHIARHEVEGSLSDFLHGGSYLLRRGGKMSLVYPAVRVADLLVGMREVGVEVKRLRWVHSSTDGPATLVLVEGVKGGGSGLKVLPPLVVYSKKKEYTEEMKAILEG